MHAPARWVACIGCQFLGRPFFTFSIIRLWPRTCRSRYRIESQTVPRYIPLTYFFGQNAPTWHPPGWQSESRHGSSCPMSIQSLVDMLHTSKLGRQFLNLSTRSSPYTPCLPCLVQMQSKSSSRVVRHLKIHAPVCADRVVRVQTMRGCPLRLASPCSFINTNTPW